MPAACYIHEAARIGEFADDRHVAVAYCGPESKLLAETAASWIEGKCHPGRVGIIDLVDKLQFPAHPEAFIEWWDDNINTEGRPVQDGPTFIREVDRKAKWRRARIAGLDDDDGDAGGDVRDPIGDIDPKAFHGPLGKLALDSQPETEANPVFVLMHLLTFFGAAVGRDPHFVVSASRHHLNLFVGLIGISGWSRARGPPETSPRRSGRRRPPTSPTRTSPTDSTAAPACSTSSATRPSGPAARAGWSRIRACQIRGASSSRRSWARS